MLLQFAVENYLSFKNEAVLNMTSTTDSSHQSHIVYDEHGKKTSVLRAAALYGANAAGKSNLIKAIEFARNLVVNGTRPDEIIPVSCFKLDPEYAKKPSKFEFVIKHGGFLYTYGFAVDRHNVAEEWLSADSGKGEKSYYERTTDEKGQVEVKFGPIMKPKEPKKADFFNYIALGTRPNQLFLTELYEKNVDVIKHLFHWFRDVLTFLRYEKKPISYLQGGFSRFSPQTYFDILLARIEEEPELRYFMNVFLGTAVREIQGIYVLRVESMIGPVRQNSNDEKIADEDERTKYRRELITFHKNQKNQEEPIPLRIYEESEGTQRLIQIIPVIFDAITQGKVFVIDEIELSLHPLLSRLFLQSFLNTAPYKGQIIFTTHETALMDLDLLRRDEIWFAEKDEEESSRIYSLAEFSVRKDLKIDKGYLQGRFGAIPFFGDASNLGIHKES